MIYQTAKIISNDLLDELYEDFKSGTMPTRPGGMSSGKGGDIYNDYRKCTVMTAPVALWKDIAVQIEEYIGDGSRVNQFDYILYQEGDWFVKHNDTGKSFPNRKWTTVTLMKLSDDYEGQGLALYDEEDNEVFPKMEVGDTIIFDSNIYHEAKPVKKGTRLVLVAWLANNS
jgi:Rps23 Pro-64 3,4-dihydroxylase Tpa1-like proline 4-hydroxylase